MKFPIFQVDAFASGLFKGNPAAVVLLTNWLADNKLQQIAAENNLSETAFFIADGDEFQIRWFTPKAEVDLCGHATLATAHVVFNEMKYQGEMISFNSKSGVLNVVNLNGMLQLDFPADKVSEVTIDPLLEDALCFEPMAVYKGKTDYLLLYETEDIIQLLRPNFTLLNQINARGIIVTAEGSSVDFVSRFFAPQVGVNEDPVTGSAHTSLIPFWAERLGKMEMKALQLSARGGELACTLANDRVLISGQAVTYLRGVIDI